MPWKERLTERLPIAADIADRFEELFDIIQAEFEDPNIFEEVHAELIERW